MKNKVLIVGAISSYSVRQFYEATIKLNKDAIFLFHRDHIPESYLLKKDNHIVTRGLSIEWLEQVMDSIKDIQKDIFSIVPGGELAVPLTEKLCEIMGLPFNQGDIRRFRNKKTMRDSLSLGNINQPEQYGIVDSEEKIHSLTAKLKYPLIIKPVDGAASFFVKKIHNASELPDAVNAIISHKISRATGVRFEGMAVLEQYVSGTEYSAEVMVFGGTCVNFYITRKLLSDEPYFDEVGHISLPSEYYPNGSEQLVSEVIKAMQVTNAVLHIEFRQTPDGTLYIIEVASRIAGDLISNLVNLKHGGSLEEFYILARSGNLDTKQEKKDIQGCIHNFIGIRFLFGENVIAMNNITIIQEDIAQKYSASSGSSPKNVINRTGYTIFGSDTLDNAIQFIRA